MVEGLSSEAQLIWSVLSTLTDVFFLTILVSAVPILVLIVPIFFTNPHNYENKA